jgi:hypothetical protein
MGHISYGGLSMFLYEVNVLVDRGFKEDIETVNQYMQREEIVEYIANKYGDQVDFSLLLNRQWGKDLNVLLRNMSDANAGNERRKWGIENNGLCLLVSWTAEIIRDWDHYKKLINE